MEHTSRSPQLPDRRPILKWCIIGCLAIFPAFHAGRGIFDWMRGDAVHLVQGHHSPGIQIHPDTRARIRTTGCFASFSRALAHTFYNTSVRTLTVAFGPQRGAFRGDLPQANELRNGSLTWHQIPSRDVTNVVDGEESLFPEDCRRSSDETTWRSDWGDGSVTVLRFGRTPPLPPGTFEGYFDLNATFIILRSDTNDLVECYPPGSY